MYAHSDNRRTRSGGRKNILPALQGNLRAEESVAHAGGWIVFWNIIRSVLFLGQFSSSSASTTEAVYSKDLRVPSPPERARVRPSSAIQRKRGRGKEAEGIRVRFFLQEFEKFADFIKFCKLQIC